jgi:very-short-patch-repair endonuclease
MGIARARQFRKQMPASEASLWNALRSLKPLGLHFRRQVPLGR